MKPKKSDDVAMTDQHQPSGNDSDDDEEEEEEDYRGRIEVQADKWHHSMIVRGDDESDEDYEDVNGVPLESITGILLTNNSHRPIKPLKKVLEAYSSAKGRGKDGDYHQEGKFAETIGENGVGLKQGCAALSNLSFVLIRRGDGDANKFSLGIIARRLQRPEGISIPSIEFVSDDLNSLREELSTLLAGTAVGECVRSYGAGSVDAGINRLISHFRQMSSRKNGGWGHFSEVFRVVLHEVKGSTATNSNNAVLSLMDKIKAALPKAYIHLPENVQVKVHGQAVQFKHYQSRLIELTSFYRKIDITSCVGDEKDNWKDPDKGHYYIRLLFGFDRNGGVPTFCIHSRQSGRLINSKDVLGLTSGKKKDCRDILGLTNGGSDFCQGLTIIVDDMHGHLPLNPTKQGISFAEQGEAGDVHGSNLHAWIGAYAHLFYSIHRNKFGGSKTDLSAAISRLPSQQQDALTWDGPCLDECVFTEYNNVTWKFIKATRNIRCGNLKRVSAVVGKDTFWRFDDLPGIGSAAHAVASPRSNPRPKKKRNAEQSSEIDFKKMYEELKKEHKTLKKEHNKLHEKYQEKRDHKETAKKFKEEVEQLKKALDIERKRREEESEENAEVVHEKDGIIERLKKKIARLDERIKSLDSICSPRGSRQVSL